MISLDRTNRGIVGHWWWTIDRVLLVSIALLAVLGLIMVFASSPPVARLLEVDGNYFIIKHLTYLGPAILALVCVSLMSCRGVYRLAVLTLGLFGVLSLLTLFIAPEVKGATRWLDLQSFRLQPSEFVKPALFVVIAWLLARQDGLRGLPQAVALLSLPLVILALQPDLGMSVLIVAVFAIQLFVAGISWLIVAAAVAAAIAGVWAAYHWLPHVRLRIDGFVDPTTEVYQVEKALRAVAEGGLFGRGPGEGIVKFNLPEAHSDFVFAAAAEEFGVIACLLILAVFAFITLRGFERLMDSRDRFVQIAAAGLLAQFGLQALINMAVNLNLIPTKGMTLPLISYGGSSTLALAVGLGMLLALTRKGAMMDYRRSETIA